MVMLQMRFILLPVCLIACSLCIWVIPWHIKWANYTKVFDVWICILKQFFFKKNNVSLYATFVMLHTVLTSLRLEHCILAQFCCWWSQFVLYRGVSERIIFFWTSSPLFCSSHLSHRPFRLTLFIWTLVRFYLMSC